MDSPNDALSVAAASHSLVCLSCHDGAHAPNTSLPGTGKDHPWGVPYQGDIEALSPAASLSPDAGSTPGEFRVRMEEFNRAIGSIIGGRKVWWVPQNAASTRRTRIDIPLYSRGAAGSEVPFVECASCHDPHSDQALFLRVANQGSRLCYTCHAK